VGTPADGRHCTRALTCKSHSVLLKRKVEGRSKSFDELVAEHKALKEAALVKPPANQQQPVAALAVETVLNSITEPNPVEQKPKLAAGWMAPPPGLLTTSPSKSPGGSGSRMHGGGSRRSREADENLHYTIDHPRPMAVCTFGGKRLANGVILPDRNHLLPRKVIRLAIASSAQSGSGLRVRSRPTSAAAGVGGGVKYMQNNTSSRRPAQTRGQQQQQLAPAPSGGYVLNYMPGVKPSAPVSAPSGLVAVAGQPLALAPGAAGGGAAAASRVGGVHLSSLPPGATLAVSGGTALVDGGSFKTDMQDFKGGIKFEYAGRKHILPMGSTDK